MNPRLCSTLLSLALIAGTAHAEVVVIRTPDDAGIGSSELAVGDRILAAKADGEPTAPLEHPMDLEALAFGAGRVTAVDLILAEGDGRRNLTLPVAAPMPWTTALDPSLIAEADAALVDALASGNAATAWSAVLAAALESRLSGRTACWVGLHRVRVLASSGALDAATAEAGQLGAACAEAPVRDSVVARAAAAQALRDGVRDTEILVDLYQAARTDAEGLDPLLRAALDHEFGSYLGRRGRLDEAEAVLDRAVSGFAAAAPEAWGHAESLSNRAILDVIRGRFEPARARLEDAQSRMQRAAPDSLALSSLQANLAIVLRRMGETDAARALTESTLAIRTRLAPDSELVAQTVNNLGVLDKNRGDLVAAEQHYRRALAIREALDAPPMARASVLGNLANLALERLDPDASLALHRDVLAVVEPVAPGHRYVVTTRLSLGQAELLRGRLDEAEEHLEAARGLQEEISTEAPIHAAILEALGRLARERGQLQAARDVLGQALALRLQLDPGGLDAASVRLALAELDLDQGDIDAARDRLRAAIEMAAARAPGSLVEARARHRLAGLRWAADARDEALVEDAAALDAFERQRERLGGDWLQRMRFGASHRELYVDAIDRRLAADRREEAFAIQERYRAYERRRLLAGRVPLPALTAASHRVDDLAAALDPTEAVLAWVVGADRTHSFLLTGEGLAVRALPIGEADLQREIDALTVLLGVARPDPAQRDALAQRAQDLHRVLIAPWADRLADIERLVLVPDQALHRLPFAALQDAADSRYLIERHALVHAASASLYVAVAPARTRPDGVVAVGDPAVASSAVDAEARNAPSGPLPAARIEVDAIAGLYPERTLRLVGPEATEARVRAALPGAGLLHLAAHAVVDGARPLDAYVQLAREEGEGRRQAGHDDGRLAAWEVLSELTIDAELVTLSACRTARGRTLGGDGVLGLSQAFQLAGAEAVLAALWDVPDRPTAELMAVFYQVLADGHDAASALRAAQLDMLARQRARADAGLWSRLGRFLRGDRRGDAGPFEWAAFKLDGRTG